MMNDTIPPGPSGLPELKAGVSSACSTGSLPAMPPGINHAPDPMTASCVLPGNRLTFLDRHRPRATGPSCSDESHFLLIIRPVLHGPPQSFLESSASLSATRAPPFDGARVSEGACDVETDRKNA